MPHSNLLTLRQLCCMCLPQILDKSSLTLHRCHRLVSFPDDCTSLFFSLRRSFRGALLPFLLLHISLRFDIRQSALPDLIRPQNLLISCGSFASRRFKRPCRFRRNRFRRSELFREYSSQFFFLFLYPLDQFGELRLQFRAC